MDTLASRLRHKRIHLSLRRIFLRHAETIRLRKKEKTESRILRALDDRALSDIGINRVEITLVYGSMT
jgi:uncharacterized protein YjiS (DUF1127 family)